MLRLSSSTLRRLCHPLSALAAGLLLATATPVLATDFNVSSASDISNAMNSAQPGDTLIMSDGVWTNQDIDFAGFGSASAPITLRPETPGGVQLTGRSQLSISGRYLVVDGLNFEDGGDDSLGYLIEFRGSRGDADNCRLTNTQIRNYNATDRNHQYHWVEIFGQDNRVDHCRFQDHDHDGVTLVVRLDDNGQEARHLIDFNAFLDRPLGTSNGWETIRIGTSARHRISSKVVVENNLFENCDGEIEIISNKSADNIYRYNTFRSCAGTLTLRHGSGAIIDSNYILGEGKDRSGGIRVVDGDHVIVNNYIADIDDRADGAISLSAAINNGPDNGYQAVDNVAIHNNTIVDVGGSAVIFDWGFGVSRNGGLQDVLPTNVSIVNNLIRSSRTLFEGQEGSGYTWANNIAFGASLGISGRSGLQTVDPQIAVDANGLWRPTSSSPAIDGGTTLNSVTSDIDGQARVGAYDIGADEASSDPITLPPPLTVADVGPIWDMPGGGDTGGGDPVDIPVGAFLALQAEDFTAVTDPDGDGDIWEIVSDPSAHGERAIEAPEGSRLDAPSPHDTLALYNVSFSEAGTYTVYYRAYGTSGSTNSFYAPTGLGVDPTIRVNTSDDGAYRWETGVEITVAASSVGVSQQLRLGRREERNRIDAIVFHEDGSLSAEQLDALFAESALKGDVDMDGDVDFSDIAAFIAVLQSGVYQAEADCDCSTVVDFADIPDFITILQNQ